MDNKHNYFSVSVALLDMAGSERTSACHRDFHPLIKHSHSWSIRPVSLSKAHLQLFKENRNNGDFPPVSIARLGFQKQPRRSPGSLEPTDIVEERCSSLVITGDPSGYLWICSIWSSLTDADSIAEPIQTLPNVLQIFIHQQACGRCLVFLILLGHLCEKLAGEYEMILSRLDVIVGLGVRFFIIDSILILIRLTGEGTSRRP